MAVIEAERREEEYREEKEREAVPEKKDHEEWEVVAYAFTKFEWEK